MKTAMAIFTFLLLTGAINSQTSIEGENVQHDIARRYALGVIPALNFDADLGFRYGGVFNFLIMANQKAKLFMTNSCKCA